MATDSKRHEWPDWDDFTPAQQRAIARWTVAMIGFGFLAGLLLGWLTL